MAKASPEFLRKHYIVAKICIKYCGGLAISTQASVYTPMDNGHITVSAAALRLGSGAAPYVEKAA